MYELLGMVGVEHSVARNGKRKTEVEHYLFTLANISKF